MRCQVATEEVRKAEGRAAGAVSARVPATRWGADAEPDAVAVAVADGRPVRATAAEDTPDCRESMKRR